MDQHFEDIEVLISCLESYFAEYPAARAEDACMRVVARLKPLPTRVDNFDKWAKYCRGEDY